MRAARKVATAAFLAGALIAGCSKRPGAGQAQAAQDPGSPVARIDGQVITEGELTTEARGALAAVEAQYAEEVHGARARTLEGMVERRLLEAKAKREGLTVDTLLGREVTARVPEPTQEQLRAVYDQTKANGRTLPPFEQSKGEIAAFLKDQSFQTLRQAFVARLRAEARVQNLLPPFLPPKVDIVVDGPTRGNPKAPVTIVEFTDYECSFCAGAEPAIREVLTTYGERVRVVLQSFPLSIHANAPKASEAALCAGEQGRYWEMHDALYANQKALGPADLKGYARKLGLDAVRFDGCLDSGRMASTVEASRKRGEALGLNGTPSFFVNGRPLRGGQPVERFKEIIDHELAVAKR